MQRRRAVLLRNVRLGRLLSVLPVMVPPHPKRSAGSRLGLCASSLSPANTVQWTLHSCDASCTPVGRRRKPGVGVAAGRAGARRSRPAAASARRCIQGSASDPVQALDKVPELPAAQVTREPVTSPPGPCRRTRITRLPRFLQVVVGIWYNPHEIPRHVLGARVKPCR
jgi:hypothetical protein